MKTLRSMFKQHPIATSLGVVGFTLQVIGFGAHTLYAFGVIG